MNIENKSIAITALGGLKTGASSGALTDGPDGAPPQVLFIHGFGADKQSWAGNAPALFDIAQALALDLPGHGDSFAVDTSGGLQAMANQVLHCMDAANSSPVHFVGHSLGGAVAMLCAVARPEMVASLTLIAPVGLGAGVNAGFTRAFVNLDNEESALGLLRTLVHNPRLIPAPLATLLLSNLEKPGTRQALENIANRIRDEQKLMNTAVSQLKSTDKKYQVIWGLQDNINPPNESDEADFGGHWVWLDNCGHLPHIEHRVVVNDAIRDLI